MQGSREARFQSSLARSAALAAATSLDSTTPRPSTPVRRRRTSPTSTANTCEADSQTDPQFIESDNAVTVREPWMMKPIESYDATVEMSDDDTPPCDLKKVESPPSFPVPPSDSVQNKRYKTESFPNWLSKITVLYNAIKHNFRGSRGGAQQMAWLMKSNTHNVPEFDNALRFSAGGFEENLESLRRAFGITDALELKQVKDKLKNFGGAAVGSDIGVSWSTFCSTYQSALNAGPLALPDEGLLLDKARRLAMQDKQLWHHVSTLARRRIILEHDNNRVLPPTMYEPLTFERIGAVFNSALRIVAGNIGRSVCAGVQYMSAHDNRIMIMERGRFRPESSSEHRPPQGQHRGKDPKEIGNQHGQHEGPNKRPRRED